MFSIRIHAMLNYREDVMRKEYYSQGKIITKCGQKHCPQIRDKRDAYTVVKPKRAYNRSQKIKCTACE